MPENVSWDILTITILDDFQLSNLNNSVYIYMPVCNILLVIMMITIIVAQWENCCMLICKFCFALYKNNKLLLLLKSASTHIHVSESVKSFKTHTYLSKSEY